MRPDVRSGYVAAKSTHIGPPSEMPNSVARSDPAASITARTSSMRCSSEGKSTRRSESPVPRRSSMMSRENDASRVRKRAYEGSSQAYSTWETQPGTRTRSGPASPTTWYAMWTLPLFAYFVSARMNGQLPPCGARRQRRPGRVGLPGDVNKALERSSTAPGKSQIAERRRAEQAEMQIVRGGEPGTPRRRRPGRIAANPLCVLGPAPNDVTRDPRRPGCPDGRHLLPGQPLPIYPRLAGLPRHVAGGAVLPAGGRIRMHRLVLQRDVRDDVPHRGELGALHQDALHEPGRGIWRARSHRDQCDLVSALDDDRWPAPRAQGDVDLFHAEP